jgi:type I restriction enzyme S subunit
MRIELKQVLFPQPKSKIKAGDGKAEGKYKFFTSSPIQSKFVDEANYDKPSLIFGTGGNASVHFCNEPFSTSTDCLVMYGRSKTELETIYNYLKSNIGILENGFKGAGLKHISKDYILAIEIDLPREEIQLDFLQKNRIIDGLIEAKQAQLHLSEELVKSRFIEMFGDPVKNTMNWPRKPLNDVCDGIGDGLHGTPEYDDNGDYPFINGNNLIDGNIVITPATKMVAEDTYKKHLINICENAILISINGTLGKMAFYHGEKVMLGKSACYCNLKPDINKTFVYGVMKSDAFAEFLDNSSTKSTIKNVGLKAMREYQLILPPMELQEYFATFVEQTDKSKFEIQQSLEKLEILKKSLMQQYFG